MHEAVAAPLEAWASFYVIVGSSAGALTGLQFVVMTLIADAGPIRARGESISAFGTPNVVHFCSALLVSAILTIPWGGLRTAGIVVAACGVLGVVYSAIVVRRALRQRVYEPVFEDWLWHTALPFLAYATLLLGGAVLGPDSANALLAIGPAALLLVFVGIHNAWDTVTYLMLQRAMEQEQARASPGQAAEAPATVAHVPAPGPGPAAGASESPASRAPGTSSSGVPLRSAPESGTVSPS